MKNAILILFIFSSLTAVADERTLNTYCVLERPLKVKKISGGWVEIDTLKSMVTIDGGRIKRQLFTYAREAYPSDKDILSHGFVDSSVTTLQDIYHGVRCQKQIERRVAEAARSQGAVEKLAQWAGEILKTKGSGEGENPTHWDRAGLRDQDRRLVISPTVVTLDSNTNPPKNDVQPEMQAVSGRVDYRQ